MHRLLASVPLLSVLLACGGGAFHPSGERAPPSSGLEVSAAPTPPATAGKRAEDVASSLEGGKRVWERAEALRDGNTVSELCTQAIDFALFATHLAASPTLITSGTLTQRSSQRGDWVYAPTPPHRLELVLADGGWASVEFIELQGALSSSEAFFSNDRQLSIHVQDSSMDLLVTSRVANGQTLESMMGEVAEDGTPCRWDTRREEVSESAISDAPASSFTSDSKVLGLVSCGAQSVRVEESQQRQFYLRDGRSLWDLKRRFEYEWNQGEDVFQLTDGHLHHQKEGEYSKVYQMSGALLRNDQPVGGIRMEEEELNAKTGSKRVRAFLVMDTDTHLLEDEVVFEGR